MRFLAVILCTASLCAAADYSTGQAARLVIGQPTFTAQQPGASATILGGVGGIAYANGTLVVADSNRIGASPANERVLIFRNLGSQLPAPDASIPVSDARCPVCLGSADIVLGQEDFTKNDDKRTRAGNTVRQPTAVATDGRRLAVADTNNNRVLIWNDLPTRNDQPADLVLGQASMTTAGAGTSNTALKGPQGVWIHGDRLFVADTQNHRVLIWNRFPTANNAAADVVLGFADFNTTKQGLIPDPSPSSLLNPVAVTSDGTRLFVSDLGHNRVLIWNSVPTANNASADIVLGQPDFSSSSADNSSKLCESNGKDDDGNDTYPSRCAATMNFPRFALSDGQRLFVADGGNDRVLVYNAFPTRNGQPADVVLGQPAPETSQISNSDSSRWSASDAMRTPLALATDGTNLFVADPFNRRVLVYTPGERLIPNAGVRNAAAREIFAVGVLAFSGEAKKDEEVKLKIGEKEYNYKIGENSSIRIVLDGLAALVNAGAGDPLVLASVNQTVNALIFTAREAGPNGNNVQIEVSTTPETTAAIIPSSLNVTLSGGQDAAQIAPYSLVSLIGDNLSSTTASADMNADELPRELGGVEVYFDGIRAPLLFVSPTQINAQIPREVSDAQSVTAFVRIRRSDGSITTTTAVGVPIITENPGIFAEEGTDPRPAIARHGSSFATGTILFTGQPAKDDIAYVTIEDREYSVTVAENESIISVRDRMATLISEQDPRVTAQATQSFGTWLQIRARVPGVEGEGITFAGRTKDGSFTVSPTNTATCCARVEDAMVTSENPAVPGQYIKIIATGLGLVQEEEARNAMITGRKYSGPGASQPNEFVSALAGAKTANVIYARLLPGTFGLYEVMLELNNDIPTNPFTQLTIAQSFQVSNIVTLPVVNPAEQ
ncbi:MAG: hypothetical protein SFV54_13120 [Bryobacteraceae bacterium]|nr:hypothetical protein [Bryobacteraceae bacterium]